MVIIETEVETWILIGYITQGEEHLVAVET